MSNFKKRTRHPYTGMWELASYVDDYFGKGKYGVQFGDGQIIDPEKIWMETNDTFKKVNTEFAKGKNNISYVGEDFEKWFGDMEMLGSINRLTHKITEIAMSDKEIIDTIKTPEVSLSDILNQLPSIDKHDSCIFYAKDNENILRAISIYWYGYGWRVDALETEDPTKWGDGRKVYYINLDDDDVIDPSVLNDAIKVVKRSGYKIIKEI